MSAGDETLQKTRMQALKVMRKILLPQHGIKYVLYNMKRREFPLWMEREGAVVLGNGK